MRVRFSTVIGLPIRQEDSGEVLGFISGILLHPDTGTVEGFFVSVPNGILGSENLFLSSLDVRRLTTTAVVRGPWVLSPPEEILRVEELLRDTRTVLGQKIRTVSGQVLGKCSDVQFDTVHFKVECIFPKKFWRWGRPIPVREILEVKRDAIIIRDPERTIKEKAAVQAPVLPTMPEAV